MLPELFPKERKKKKPRGSRRRAPDSYCQCATQNATHKFRTNILPGKQDGHSPRKTMSPIEFGDQRAPRHPETSPNWSCSHALQRHRRIAGSRPLHKDQSGDSPGRLAPLKPRRATPTRFHPSSHHLSFSHPSPHHNVPWLKRFSEKQCPLRRMRP